MEKRNEAPARMAIHPGSILKEEIRERGIKQRELALQMGIQPSHLSEIIRGKRPVNKGIADKLERVLGLPSIHWMRLQLAYEYDLMGLPRETGVIEPVHPGRILNFELSRRGVSASELEAKMGIPAGQLGELLSEKCRLDAGLALMLEAAVGINASRLLSMQNEYDMLMAEQDSSFMERLRHIRQIAAAL